MVSSENELSYGCNWNGEDSNWFLKSVHFTKYVDVKAEMSGTFWALSNDRSLVSPFSKKWICRLYSYTYIQYIGKVLVPQTKNNKKDMDINISFLVLVNHHQYHDHTFM